MLGHIELILPDRGYPNIGVKYIFPRGGFNALSAIRRADAGANDTGYQFHAVNATYIIISRSSSRFSNSSISHPDRIKRG